MDLCNLLKNIALNLKNYYHKHMTIEQMSTQLLEPLPLTDENHNNNIVLMEGELEIVQELRQKEEENDQEEFGGFYDNFEFAVQNGLIKSIIDLVEDRENNLSWEDVLISGAFWNSAIAVQLSMEKNPNMDLKKAFIRACYAGSLEVVQIFVIRGVKMFNTGLISACEGGNVGYGRQIDVIKFMVRNGANDFNWGLICACEVGFFEAAQLMLQEGADDISWALLVACKNERPDMVRLILTRKPKDVYIYQIFKMVRDNNNHVIMNILLDYMQPSGL